MNTTFTNWQTPFNISPVTTPWLFNAGWSNGSCPVNHGQNSSPLGNDGYGPNGWWFGMNTFPSNSFVPPFQFGYPSPWSNWNTNHPNANGWNTNGWNTNGWNTNGWNTNNWGTGGWNTGIPTATTPWLGSTYPSWCNTPGFSNYPTTPWNTSFQNPGFSPWNTVPSYFNSFNSPSVPFYGINPGMVGQTNPYGLMNINPTPWNSGTQFTQTIPGFHTPNFIPNFVPNSNPNFNPNYAPNYSQSYGPSFTPGYTPTVSQGYVPTGVNVPPTAFGYSNPYSTPFSNCTNTPATCAGREAA